MPVNNWSEEELRAAVSAYFEMLDRNMRGEPFRKSEIVAGLATGKIKSRSVGAISRRMYNISAVLRELGRPWILTYKPLENIGPTNRRKLIEIITNIARKSDSFYDDRILDELTSDLRINFSGLSAKPPTGVYKPLGVYVSTVRIPRDPAVRAWVLTNSKGICEGCQNLAPFSMDNGLPFLEVHHLKRLADGGPDVVENAIAVCPNCHRRLHYSKDRDFFLSEIFSRGPRLSKY